MEQPRAEPPPSAPEVVRLDAMAHGPEAVGKLASGKVVFVRGGAPGDVAELAIFEDHARYARASITRLEVVSQARREPFCAHARAGECGGCPWQHLDETTQEQEKAALVLREVRRVQPDALVRPIRVDVPKVGYRRRARLGHKPQAGGPAVVGFRQPAQRRIFSLHSCPVLDPRLDLELGAIARALADRRAGSVDLLVDAAGEIHVGGPAAWFAQPSADTERVLIELVLEAIPRSANRVAELFSGAGTFTEPLVRRGHEVSAWELDRGSIQRLTERLPDVLARRADLLRQGLDLDLGAPDAVLLDPPRAGALPCMKPICASGAPHVVYVSCDPVTLCRDLRELSRGGYRIEWVQPVDAFPQTFHVETVCLLRRLP